MPRRTTQENIVEMRTYCIRNERSDRGIVVALDYDGKQFLVTASKVIQKLGVQQQFEIEISPGRWQSVGFDEIGCTDRPNAGITVMVAKRQEVLLNCFKIRPEGINEEVQQDQELVCCGFDHNWKTGRGENSSNSSSRKVLLGCRASTNSNELVMEENPDVFRRPHTEDFSGGPVVCLPKILLLGVVTQRPSRFESSSETIFKYTPIGCAIEVIQNKISL